MFVHFIDMTKVWGSTSLFVHFIDMTKVSTFLIRLCVRCVFYIVWASISWCPLPCLWSLFFSPFCFTYYCDCLLSLENETKKAFLFYYYYLFIIYYYYFYLFRFFVVCYYKLKYEGLWMIWCWVKITFNNKTVLSVFPCYDVFFHFFVSY